MNFQSLEATLKGELTLLMNNELDTVRGALTYATVAELSFGTAIRIASAIPTTFTPARLKPKNTQAAARILDACEEAAEQLKKGLKLATEAEGRRNQIVHSHWFISSGYVAPEGKMTRMKAKTRKGSFSIEFTNESLADLESVADNAGKAQEFIGAALRDYRSILQLDWDSLVGNPSPNPSFKRDRGLALKK